MATDKISFRLPSRLIEAVESALPNHGNKISAVIVAALRAYLLPAGETAGQPVGGTWRESIEARLTALESGKAAGVGKRVAVNQAGPADSGYDENKIREVIESVRAQCKASGDRFTHGAVATALNAEGLKTYGGLSWEGTHVKTFIQRKM